MATSLWKFLAGLPVFGIVPNASRHVGDCVFPVQGAQSHCELLVLEFDDQGLWFEPDHAVLLARTLAALEGQNPVIVVFAHGWKHNAAAADDNLAEFKRLLAHTADDGARDADGRGVAARPVLGVFLSWRGLSRDGNWVWQQSSFWDRQQAAQRVALGSAREALGILRAFRNGPDGRARATLLIVGHSFGGAVIYAAVAQSLIEAAAAEGETTPSFGDLVLLVNPAFSAVSYLPVFGIVARGKLPGRQLPVFVSVTAENDLATKYLYPAGNLYRIPTEATRTPHQRDALIRTMGHLDWMRTHRLSAPGAVAALAAWQPDHARERAAMRQISCSGETVSFGPVTVTSLPERPASPFWVASATPAVINGHNGIFQVPFVQFVRALVAAHIQADQTPP